MVKYRVTHAAAVKRGEKQMAFFQKTWQPINSASICPGERLFWGGQQPAEEFAAAGWIFSGVERCGFRG